MSLKNWLRISLSIAFLIFLSIGCKKDKNNNADNKQVDTTISQPAINEEAINEIINSFPQPVEMAALIKDLNVPFSKKYLLDPKKTENYDTNKKKALALGILSADLGYLNIYEKSTLIVEYLSAIKRLADALRIGQFFDFHALKRMATNNSDLDSLMFVTLNSFTDMHQHLTETGRSNLSLLMVTGVWIEGLYLLCEVAEDTQHKTNDPQLQVNYEKLKDKIGEQKVLFDILYKVIILYKDDEYFAKVIKNLDQLKDIYSNVTITIKKGEPETKIVDSQLVIIQNEESVVNITDDQVKAIISTTKKIRNNLINL